MHLLSPVGATRQARACLKARAMLAPKGQLVMTLCSDLLNAPGDATSEQQPGPVSQYYIIPVDHLAASSPFFWHLQLEKDPSGEIIYLIRPGNASRSPLPESE